MKFWRRRSEAAWRWEALATYNSEVARGLVHTHGYKAHMAREQAAFDAEALRAAQAKGWVVLGPYGLKSCSSAITTESESTT